MERTEFFGSVATDDLEVMRAVVAAWVGEEGVRARIGRVGGEVAWARDGHSLFAHESAGDGLGFLLEGHTSRSLEEARVWLERLLHLCRERGVAGDFDYVRVDEGREVSPEHNVR